MFPFNYFFQFAQFLTHLFDCLIHLTFLFKLSIIYDIFVISYFIYHINCPNITLYSYLYFISLLLYIFIPLHKLFTISLYVIQHNNIITNDKIIRFVFQLSTQIC